MKSPSLSHAARWRWLAGALLLTEGTWAVAQARNPETPMLGQAEYRISLEDVVVFGQAPYWRPQEKPRWEEPALEIPKEKSQFRWAPRYTGEERDEGPPDELNPKPRAKIFEFKF